MAKVEEEKLEEVDEIDDEDDELVVGGETVVVSELEVVVVVDFTLEIATYAPPAAIRMITMTTTTISPTLLRPVLERFKLLGGRSCVS